MFKHAQILLLLSMLPSADAKLDMVYKHQHLVAQAVFPAEIMLLHALSQLLVHQQSLLAIQDLVYKHQQLVAQAVFPAEIMLFHALSQLLVQQQLLLVILPTSSMEQHALKIPQQTVPLMSIPHIAHHAPAHHTSPSLVHAQQEPLVTVLLITPHNVFNALLDITFHQHHHAQLAHRIVWVAQVLQTVHHATLDIMLLLTELAFQTQPPHKRMLRSLLQDLLSLPSSSSSSSKELESGKIII